MTNIMPVPRKARKRVLVVDDDRALTHVLVEMLEAAGFAAEGVGDGLQAVQKLDRKKFDLVLLDIGLPKMTGLEVLKQIRERGSSTRVIVMTVDDAPGTVLNVVKDQAYQYIAKPVAPKAIVEIVEDALSRKSEVLPIEVVSAKPEWLELLVPCQFESADRIQSFIETLNANLSADIRESVGRAFRELLLNAIEWGGRLDPNRKVRIAYIRARRMLLYRIQDPGPGFNPENLRHAAVSNAPDDPVAHLTVREQQQLRPGGFGLMMTRAMVDELIYNEAHNEVVFVKYLDP
jgi:DNA-binding response OmpR family regulator